MLPTTNNDFTDAGNNIEGRPGRPASNAVVRVATATPKLILRRLMPFLVVMLLVLFAGMAVLEPHPGSRPLE